ncbi:recombination mediator RecR [Rothia sp. CCM 9418]|uniref:recombination mediator RecR n=1 Tax=Rothia sp. CCM 9418 TaxID=3402661 RepID=UPI003AE77694
MYDAAVQNLIDELGRLPGVGPKSAQRIAFHILNADSSEMQKLTNAINTVKNTVSFCQICGNISETDQCAICRDERRTPTTLCVVEESKDVISIERTRSFHGRYHVLGGAINPLAGLTPEQLRIRELIARLADERIEEIILAMDPNLEGEATATYLSRLLVPLGVRVSRLASGLPVGGDLEYADEITLGRALEGRRIIAEGNRHQTENHAEAFTQAVAEDQERQVQNAPTPQPRPRWNGSMFEDLSEEHEDAPQQSTLNEPLLEELDAETITEPEGSSRSEEQDDSSSQQQSYQERLEELKKTPLRTPTPQIPPIPGRTYVNPWQ